MVVRKLRPLGMEKEGKYGEQAQSDEFNALERNSNACASLSNLGSNSMD